MAYVDFDGELVLNKAMTEYQQKELDEVFLRKYCSKMMKAIELLEDWVDKLQ